MAAVLGGCDRKLFGVLAGKVKAYVLEVVRGVRRVLQVPEVMRCVL